MNSHYFQEYEYECNCGCGISLISQELLTLLDKAREKANMPFLLSSGCRCEDHNEHEKGSKNSSHITTNTKRGTAVDIAITSSHARFTILKALLDVGFNRVGIAKTFIHVDVDTTKAPAVSWVY